MKKVGNFGGSKDRLANFARKNPEIVSALQQIIENQLKASFSRLRLNLRNYPLEHVLIVARPDQSQNFESS